MTQRNNSLTEELNKTEAIFFQTEISELNNALDKVRNMAESVDNRIDKREN